MTGGTTTTLASGLAYAGVGGAFGELTGMHLGGGYDYSAIYDLLDRATDLKTKRTSDNAVLFDQTRTFDGAGNVTATQTTMPAGTDNQAFCYDEQDRLNWSSSATVTPPCGGSNTAGTLTAAQYTQAFSYDVLGRLSTGPLGSYAYGSAAHVHAATGIGAQYTAAYDAMGNMTCRAPSSSTTCAGTQTGAQLGYNNEGELTTWQNTPTGPTTTAKFLYDGHGQRVEQVATTGSTTTTTVYLGVVEEVATTTGGAATFTAYYYAAGKRIALSTNGVVSYLATDGLGSANVTLSAGGSATASVMYAPYGGMRYTSGTMPTTYGFTGQRADAASGLDYYGARYYDPLASQFTIADSILPGKGYDVLGLSRYAYVNGNPISRTDPSGHDVCVDDGSGTCLPGGGGGFEPGGYSPPPPPPPGGGGSNRGPGSTGGPGQPNPTPGPSPAVPNGDATIPVLSGLEALISAFNGPHVDTTKACEPDGPCYIFGQAGYQECVQSGRCSLFTVCDQSGCWAAAIGGVRGGRASVDKGSAGEDLVQSELEARGYEVVGRQVEIETKSATIKVDIIARAPDGTLIAVEAKTGPAAELNSNQRIGYRELATSGGIPRGANARAAGLPVGRSIAPMEFVQVYVPELPIVELPLAEP